MAKTINEFIEDIKSDEGLKEAISTALTKDSTAADVIAFASERGYDFTEADMNDLQEKVKAEMSDEDLDKIAGGMYAEGGDAMLCMILFMAPLFF